MKKKTIAQEALDLLSPIPADKWCIGAYMKDDRMCALAHYAHRKHPEVEIKSETQFFVSPSILHDAANILEDHTRHYFWNHQDRDAGLADVNNGEVKSYFEREPKDRTISVLKDMIREGY